MLSLYRHPAIPQDAPEPLLLSSDPKRITAELAERGIGMQHWPARAKPEAGANQAAILSTDAEVAQIQQGGAYPCVDKLRLTPDHPKREAMRRKFLAEHTHAEGEVLFFKNPEGWVARFTGEPITERYPLLD